MNIGDAVDDFSLLDQQGQSKSLGELLEDGFAVLYFYVKAKTPG